jgi:HEAT repeat protein
MEDNIAPTESRSFNRCTIWPEALMYRLVTYLVVFLCLATHPLLCQENGKLPADPQKRIDEMYANVAMLPGAQDSVVAALGDEDLSVRYETLKELTNQDHLPQAVRNSVTQLISSQDSYTRTLAIECLAHTRVTDPAEKEAITNALRDPVTTVRLSAIQATPMLDVSSKCPIDDLLASLEDSDTSVQLGALKVLPKIDCKQTVAVGVLGRLAEKSPSSQVRTAALKALGNLSANIDETTGLLLQLALKDGDADVRREAVRALQSVQSLTAGQASSLSSLVQDSSSRLRMSAAYTFVILGRKYPDVLMMVSSLQADRDQGVRDAVAEALRYGETKKIFLVLIAKSLRDKSLEVRLDASASLLKLKGDEDDPADKDSGPDDLALATPGEIWPKELVDASLEILNQSGTALLRENIENAIRRFGVYDERLVNRLSDLATADPDPWCRRAAVRAISNTATTPRTLAALIATTRDSDLIVRKQAVMGLGKLSEYQWPLSEPRTAGAAFRDIEVALAARLDDQYPGVRIAAFQALDSLRAASPSVSKLPKLQSTTALVMAALQDKDPDIREAAAKTLGSLELSEIEIKLLLASIGDDNFDVGIQAAKSLANIDFFNDGVKQSVGLMPITFLDFTTLDAVIARTTHDLASVSPKCHAIDALMDSLRTVRGSELHFQEMQSLADIASNANSMVNALQDGEPPPNRQFIKAAGSAVDECAPSIERAEGYLAQQLDSPDPQIRVLAVTAAASLELQSEKIVSTLERLSRDENREVRKAAVASLPNVLAKDDPSGPREAANKLVEATRDSDSEVRLAAVDSLVRLGSLEGLSQSFHSPDPEIRVAIIRAYTTLGTPVSSIAPILREGLTDRDRRVRLQTLSYLNAKGRGSPDLLADVVPLFSDSSGEIRAAAAALFGYYRADAAFAVPPLQRLLTDEDSKVKIAAAESLGWIGPPARESVAGLISLLTDEAVGTHAQLALQQIGDAAIPQLTIAVQSSSDKNQAQQVAKVLEIIRLSQRQRLLILRLKDGDQQSINLQGAVVIAVASWCPYSRKLRDFLVREEVKPYFNGFSFYFLLENETNTVAAHIQEEFKDHKDWTEARKKEVLSEVREQVAAVGFYDESFPNSLPGERFQVMALSKLAVPAFPSVLSPASAAASPEDMNKESWLGVHDWAASHWFSEHINMPEAMRSELESISGNSIFGF